MLKNPPAMQETQETWVPFLDQERPLEEGTAAHASILAWEIPGPEGTSRSQSIVSQRVRQDSSD